MKLQSRLHQLTSFSDDAWIFRGGRAERIQRCASRALDLFNAVAITVAMVLLLSYWIGVFLP